MKELDFDELDRAVNSLMSQSGNTPPQPANQPSQESNTFSVAQKDAGISSPVPTVGIPTRPTTVVDARPSIATPARTNTPSPTPVIPPQAPPPTPSLATKRSGRFMDVVHPSSDMTKPPLVATSPAEKITLTPINTGVVPEESTPEQNSISTPTISPTPEVQKVSNEQPSWPDPLEFHEQAQSSAQSAGGTEVSKESNQPSVAEPVSTPVVSALSEATEEPSPSPFITDAKVEKRPLGGTPNNEQPISDTQDQPPISTTQNSFATQSLSPDDVQTTPKVELPAELHSDLLAVESDEAAKLPVVSSSSTPPATAESGSSGPVSIVQQYKKQETSRDTSHTAMYDNAAQPLTHPARKKSGWLGVVLILTIIILLVGAAAAAYFMGFIPL